MSSTIQDHTASVMELWRTIQRQWRWRYATYHIAITQHHTFFQDTTPFTNMSTIFDLARKLNALAVGGVGGEKETAAIMLQRLLRKHNLTIEDIEGIEIKDHFFEMVRDEERLFLQVVVSSFPGLKIYDTRGNKTARKHLRIIVKCTAAQAVEIHAKFDFYLNAWRADLKTFFSAFVHKNHLGKPLTEAEENEPEKPLSSEEKAELWRISNMMNGLDKHHFHKQLKNK